jgi:hypothetical protein
MYLKSYHLVLGQTINVFGAIFGISLPLISKDKAVRQMAGFLGDYLKSYHLVLGQTINVFGAIFGISLPLISKDKAVRQMAGFLGD